MTETGSETTYHLMVQGTPVPTPRPRVFVNKHTGRAQAVTAPTGKRGDALRQWKFDISKEATEIIPRTLTGPVAVHALFVLKRPLSHFRAGGELKQGAPYYHTKRPDTDNLVKGLKDALHGIAYHDDAQVCVESIKKRYTLGDERPCTIVQIEALEKQE